MKTITLSAFATDYNDKCYKLHYANDKFEFIPKSKCTLDEAPKGINHDTPESCYFTIPLWLAERLKGIDYYDIF